MGILNLRSKIAVCLTPGLLAAIPMADDIAYLCSLVRGVECNELLECGPPELDRPAPTFLRVDPDADHITLLAPEERRGEVTQIGAKMRDGDNLIMTGIEAERAWTMILSEADGKMALTINFGNTGYVVFGACMPADETTP